jgi:SAM-dependent methyltransferase
MNRSYWEAKGRCYESEIFDVYAEDRGGIVEKSIRELAARMRVPRRSRSAADLGCGTGKALTLLSSLFATVDAVDLSSSCVREAREVARDCPGVNVRRADLARDRSARPVDLVLSVNVLIMPDAVVRAAVWRTLARRVRPGGYAVVVVPSMESVLWTAAMLHRWERREGRTPEQAWRTVREMGVGHSSSGLIQGCVDIDGVPTQHHLREDLEMQGAELGLELKCVEKVTYGWHTEFERPPRWMERSGPWDWLAIYRKPLK